MKINAVLIMLTLALAPGPGFAHGERPVAAHGGDLQEAAETWLELVVKGNDVKVYVLDHAHKPIPASRVSGTATVLVEGKSHKVELSPAEGNAVQGKLPVSAMGRIVAAVALRIDGKPVSARFTGAT